jgi:prepilin-type N-terminal cleavage/methylation domain-containing protein
MHTQHARRPRGFTLVELLVVIAIIGILLAILLPALARARATARTTQDAAQIKQIHAGWLSFAAQNAGILPTPGLKARLAVNGQFIPGRGAEDVEANDHANVNSLCVMELLYPPELCHSPAEQSPNVVPMGYYDFNRKDVVNNVYWDDRFKADLQNISHTSYAMPPLAGDRKRRHWNNGGDSGFAVLGTRGPENGEIEEIEDSITSEIHNPPGEWGGNIGYNDNSVSFEQGFFPEKLKRVGPNNDLDNLFANDTASGNSSDGSDVWLVVVKEQSGNGGDVVTVITWD